MGSNREWSGGFMRKLSISAFVALVLAFPFHASAARVQGLFSGVFSGNDSVASLATNLSLDPALLSQLAKVDWPSVSEDSLAISNLTLNEDDEAIADSVKSIVFADMQEKLMGFVASSQSASAAHDENPQLPGEVAFVQ